MRDPELWMRLEAFEFEAVFAGRGFAARLAAEQGWPESFARAVLEEYRKFLYLACVSETEVTPSEPVDAAWHLHLSATRSYREVLCEEVLQRVLHHDPSKGAFEAGRFARQYAETLALYRQEFEGDPHTGVWQMGAPRKNRGRWEAMLFAGILALVVLFLVPFWKLPFAALTWICVYYGIRWIEAADAKARRGNGTSMIGGCGSGGTSGDGGGAGCGGGGG